VALRDELAAAKQQPLDLALLLLALGVVRSLARRMARAMASTSSLSALPADGTGALVSRAISVAAIHSTPMLCAPTRT
jgi:hypothetical protein